MYWWHKRMPTSDKITSFVRLFAIAFVNFRSARCYQAIHDRWKWQLKATHLNFVKQLSSRRVRHGMRHQICCIVIRFQQLQATSVDSKSKWRLALKFKTIKWYETQNAKMLSQLFAHIAAVEAASLKFSSWNSENSTQTDLGLIPGEEMFLPWRLDFGNINTISQRQLKHFQNNWAQHIM